MVSYCDAVDLTGNMSDMLGFGKAIYRNQYTMSSNVCNLDGEVDAINIHCSLITSSYLGGRTSDVIYSHCLNEAPNDIVSVTPANVMRMKLETKRINNIQIYLTDQQNRPLDMAGKSDSVFVTLVIEEYDKGDTLKKAVDELKYTIQNIK
jgi:hypothetical protein